LSKADHLDCSFRLLLDALAAAGDWGEVFRQQGFGNASSARTRESVKRQLLLEGEQLETAMKCRFDQVAIAGSDLYVAEGGDLSLFILGSEADI
jgi:hypothetical protein